MRAAIFAATIMLATSFCAGQTLPVTAPAVGKPTVFVIGDAPWTKGLESLVDPNRTAFEKVSASEVAAREHPGDYVLIAASDDDAKSIVEAAKAKDAVPVLIGTGKQLAVAEKIAFIDLPAIEKRESGAGGDEAHSLVAGLKALHRQLLDHVFVKDARVIDPAMQSEVVLAHYGRPAAGKAWEEANFLNQVDVADPSLPTVFCIGDSTVRNGRGDGVDGQWGWGDALTARIDPAKANVVNRALGGTGARTYMNQWPAVLAMMKPGDVVLMQFGHNDNGSRGALKGTGDETQQQGTETVHTFGWYLRRYVADVRAKGATPVVCTLIPRNTWKGDKMDRPVGTHADWARTVAKEEHVDLVDLNNLIADRYDHLGKVATTALFQSGPHTTYTGAALNADCVVQGLEALPDRPVHAWLRATPAETW